MMQEQLWMLLAACGEMMLLLDNDGSAFIVSSICAERGCRIVKKRLACVGSRDR